MLGVEEIHTYYGLSHILFDVSLSVGDGEVVGLLGRNGADKSTTMRSIMGLTAPRKGRITYRGEDVTRKKAFILFRKGIGYVPDDRRVFADLSIDDNLEVVFTRTQDWTKARVYEIFPALKSIRTRRAGNLSGGEQQMLTIGRALMGSPDLLLLDEPTEGLAPLIVRDLEEQILRLKKTGISILLSEQNIRSALRLIEGLRHRQRPDPLRGHRSGARSERRDKEALPHGVAGPRIRRTKATASRQASILTDFSRSH